MWSVLGVIAAVAQRVQVGIGTCCCPTTRFSARPVDGRKRFGISGRTIQEAHKDASTVRYRCGRRRFAPKPPGYAGSRMNAARELVDAADERLDRARAAYAAGGEHPIASYAVMLSTYVAMVRGSGVRHAIGELLTCPFCVLVWVATLFSFGLVLAPRVTRFAASILAAVTASDSLQFAYARLQQAEHAV